MRTTICALALCLAACDESTETTCEENGGSACFVLPTTAVMAWDQAGASSAPNLSCGRPAATLSTQPVTVSGRITQYTSTDGIPGATLEAHASLGFDDPIATTTSGADGAYSVTLPAGTPSIFHVKGSGADVLPAYALYQRLDLSVPAHEMVNYTAPTQTLIDLVADVVKVEPAPGTATVGFVVTDCDGKGIEHAVVTVSSQSGLAAHTGAGATFYTAAGALPLPVERTSRADTNTNGGAITMNIVPREGTLYGQAWGFVSGADVAKGAEGLTLIAEWELPVIADAVIALPLRASR